MKIIEVECPVHGRYEMFSDEEQELFCKLKINLKPCNERLKRIISVPNVHFKGEGFTKTSRR